MSQEVFVLSKISEVNVFSEIKIFFENYSRLKWLPKGQSWSLKELFSLHKTLEPKRIDSSAYFANARGQGVTVNVQQ